MAIPKYTARRLLEVLPAGAKETWPGMMSREAGAMAGFGGTVMSVAQRWQAERDNAEISRLQYEINNFQYTALKQLEDEWRAGRFTSADQFKQVEDDYVKARDRMVSKLTKGKRGVISDRVSEYAESNKASDTANFYRNLYPKEKEFMSVEGLKVVEGYKLQGERDKALMAIEQYKYWFGLPKAELLKANLDADMAVLQHQNFLEQVAVDTREMNIADALNYINQIPRTAITEPERNGLIAQRERQEEIATATTDPMVRWRILREITDNPKMVTDDYLESNIKPDGISVTDAEQLRKIRDDKDNPLKTPRAQLYFNSLDALFDERETDAEERVKYDIANEKLVQFFETTKTPTAKQAAEFYDELIEPEVLDWVDWFGKVLRPKETTPFWRYFGTTEEEALAKKRAKAGKKEELPEPNTLTEFEDAVRLLDEEEAKAYYEKWKDKW